MIDPGGEAGMVIAFCAKHAIKPGLILATHGHFDHIGGVADLKDAWGVSYAASSFDELLYRNMLVHAAAFGVEGLRKAPPPDLDLAHETAVTCGALTLDVRPTPGHSPGSVTLAVEDHLFAGDLIFQGSIGRTDLPGGDHAALLRSVAAHIFTVPGGIIHPGHGPLTTVEAERAENPYLTGLDAV